MILPAYADSAAIRECDLAAASPEDNQRPIDVPGVTIESIIANSDAYVAALSACEQAAAQNPGNLRIAAELARMLDKYEGLENTEAAARRVELNLKAATGGYVLGMLNIARIYRHGAGVPKNIGEALKWLKIAANPPSNHRIAQFDLAEIYRTGDGVAANLNVAGPLYCASAESGFVPAMGQCGFANEFGHIGPADPDQAFIWYKKGAYLNDLVAKRQLAKAYRIGVGTTINNAMALEWATTASNADDLEARTVLGDIYYYGDGTPKDMGRAFGLYMSASTQGDASAQARLSNEYNNGYEIALNYDEAFRLAKLSAEGGNDEGLLSLGFYYDEGRGTTVDDVKAVELYRKSADLGNRGAMNNLGEMLIAGEGVERNANEGLEWLKKSSAADYGYAPYNIAVHYEEQHEGFVYDSAVVAKNLIKALKLNHYRAVENLIAKGGKSFRKRTLRRLQEFMQADGKVFERRRDSLSPTAIAALQSYMP